MFLDLYIYIIYIMCNRVVQQLFIIYSHWHPLTKTLLIFSLAYSRDGINWARVDCFKIDFCSQPQLWWTDATIRPLSLICWNDSTEASSLLAVTQGTTWVGYRILLKGCAMLKGFSRCQGAQRNCIRRSKVTPINLSYFILFNFLLIFIFFLFYCYFFTFLFYFLLYFLFITSFYFLLFVYMFYRYF